MLTQHIEEENYTRGMQNGKKTMGNNAHGAGLYGMKKCSEIVFTSALHKWTKNH